MCLLVFGRDVIAPLALTTSERDDDPHKNSFPERMNSASYRTVCARHAGRRSRQMLTLAIVYRRIETAKQTYHNQYMVSIYA